MPDLADSGCGGFGLPEPASQSGQPIRPANLFRYPFMSLDLSANYFELFDLPVTFDIDETALSTRFRALQRQLHPDRYAARPDAERRWSVQAASHVNDGYHALRRPLARAVYLLKLNGLSVDEETDTQMDPAFLMEQMTWREALEEVPGAADSEQALAAIGRDLDAAAQARSEAFRQAAAAGDWPAARGVIRQWQFLDKLQRDCQAMDARLHD